MTETQTIHPAIPGNWILAFTAFLFGGVAYLTFLFTILYAIGFVSGLAVPKTIDTGPETGWFEAIAVDLILISLCVVQHSAVARKPFKHWWTQFIPRSVGRSTAFWAAPVMSAGHLLFAAVTTACIFVGIKLEERDLIDMSGDRYHRHRERVSMLSPWHKLT
ncbi:hypothetical protein [Bradyrhizobium sp.]|uniref:hypothetical protein n=1 Tax=Bradyrhizobium sp. TaxID=376 RepID=UPI002B71E8E1|nr:hypothetical protein [Bradyrhizobium sp.]HMM88366.1 hypothetical protein [Bradyrhizobium sp.]